MSHHANNHATLENKLIEKYGGNNWWYQNKINLTLSEIEISSPNVLDLGCGTGLIGMKLAKSGKMITFVEPDHETAMKLKKKAPKNSRVIELTAEKINFHNEFTHCILLDVLEHIKDDIIVLRKIYQSLKPGGSLILNVPVLPFLETDHDKLLSHYRRYSKGELCSKLEAVGFEIKKVRNWNFISILPLLISKYFLINSSSVDAHWNITNTKLNTVLKYYLKLENIIKPFIGCSLFAVAMKPVK